MKAARKKSHITYKETKINITTDFSSEALENTRQWNYIFKALKLSTQNFISEK